MQLTWAKKERRSEEGGSRKGKGRQVSHFHLVLGVILLCLQALIKMLSSVFSLGSLGSVSGATGLSGMSGVSCLGSMLLWNPLGLFALRHGLSLLVVSLCWSSLFAHRNALPALFVCSVYLPICIFKVHRLARALARNK